MFGKFPDMFHAMVIGRHRYIRIYTGKALMFETFEYFIDKPKLIRIGQGSVFIKDRDFDTSDFPIGERYTAGMFIEFVSGHNFTTIAY